MLRTPVCEMLGCDVPVVQAGMGGVARSELVTAVSEAGGFGFLGMVREDPSFIAQEVSMVRSRTRRRFGVNLIPAATPADLLERQVRICIERKVPGVCLFWDLAQDLVARLRAAEVVVVCQIGSAAEAAAAEVAGAQILIAQGVEAGGHVRGRAGLSALVPDVCARVNIPVLAAGGIVDGAGLVAALALGAQGVVVGSAFLATDESFAHNFHKDRVVTTASDTTVHTEAFHINWPLNAPVRVLPNSVTRGERREAPGGAPVVIGEDDGRPIYLFSTDSPLRSTSGELEAMPLYAGQSVARIQNIIPAGHRLRQIVAQADELLAGGITRASPEPNAADLRDLVGFLNFLLEKQRASIRATQYTISRDISRSAREVLAHVADDEARWCAVVSRAVRRLGGSVSNHVSASGEEAMAMADLHERLTFLNDERSWIVRQIRTQLAMVSDSALRAELEDMANNLEMTAQRMDGELASMAQAALTGQQPPQDAGKVK